MSSDDKIRLRSLPPVPPIAWPDRLSQTLAQWHDKCPRAAYLYVKTGGGMATHQMDRGSLYHAGAAQLMADAILGKEEVRSGNDDALSHWTAATLDAVAREHPELVVSHKEMDVARACLYHTALGLDVNPEHVAGIEQKFILELPESGWNVSGIIDLAALPSDDEGEVHDYKTQLHVPAKSDWDPFQCKLYAATLAFGYPVEKQPCPVCAGEGKVIGLKCEACGGRGTVEMALDPIGGHLSRVRGRELYPRRIRGGLNGEPYSLPYNEETWTRLELAELVHDLDRQGVLLNERLMSWDFPARSDPSWCGKCPAENECPIPRRFRRFAGHIQSVEQAEEAWSWAQRMGEKVEQTKREVKTYAADWEIAIRVGDHEWAYEQTETRKLRQGADKRSDWDGLQARLRQAAENGEIVELADEGWIITSRGSTFKKRKAGADRSGGVEMKVEVQKDGRTADERWGSDAPY